MVESSSQQNRRVLVTGASGFIGSATVRALTAAGWDVYRAVRHPQTAKEVRIDLADVATITDLGSLPPCEAVVHLAGRVAWGLQRGGLFDENVLATAALFSLVREWKAHTVFASTASLYGVDDERQLGLGSVDSVEYMRSKRMGEYLLDAMGCGAIFRIGGVYGLNGPAHLGLNRAIVSALNGSPPQIMGDGAARRNYIYVEDVAQCIVTELEQKRCGIHYITGAQSLSIAEYLDAVCSVLSPGLRPELVPGDSGVDQIFPRASWIEHDRPFDIALQDIKENSR